MNLPQVSPEEITLFFNRWDRDRDGRLKFSEFTDAFSPSDSYQAAEMLDRRNANPPGYPFSEKTMDMYRHIWLLAFQVEVNERELNYRINQLEKVPDMFARPFITMET